MPFEENLKRIREQRGMSQHDLAAMMGVNQSTIVRWENGTLSPTILTAARLAKELGCTLGELIDNNSIKC